MAGDLSGTVESLSHCHHVQLASTSAHNDGIHPKQGKQDVPRRKQQTRRPQRQRQPLVENLLSFPFRNFTQPPETQ